MSHVSKNIAGALAALALAITGALLGCGTTHLGAHHGESYDRAFAAQTKAGGDDAPGLDADDARQVVDVHRHGPAKDKSGTATASSVTPVAGSTSSSSGSMDMGGSWPGAEGNITLEAK